MTRNEMEAKLSDLGGKYAGNATFKSQEMKRYAFGEVAKELSTLDEMKELVGLFTMHTDKVIEIKSEDDLKNEIKHNLDNNFIEDALNIITWLFYNPCGYMIGTNYEDIACEDEADLIDKLKKEIARF